jgi:hypothetical protein
VSGTTRRRKSRLLIGGRQLELDAPGLKQIKRKDRLELYWAKGEDAVFSEYRPATVRIHVDLSDPSAASLIEGICRREQDAMLLWLEDRGLNDPDRLRPKFNGTFESLCELYQSDSESGYADLQNNTQSSYRDSLKIIRNDIGQRRIDRVTAKYFRTCYRNWKKPAQENGEQRTRRAHGCITTIKIVLGYGVEANYLGGHCEKLLKALSKMRFAKNPPRGESMTFEQSKAIVCAALAADDVSTALVQALQYECFLRQIDIVGKRRLEPATYALKSGEKWMGKKVWKGMTMAMIVNKDNVLRFQKFRPKTDLADDLILATLPLSSARKILELSEAERHSSLEGIMPPDFGPLQWRLPDRGEDSSKLIFRSLQRWDRTELCALLAAFADPLIERIALGEIAVDHARLAFADSVDWKRFDKNVEARGREKVASFLDSLVFD